MFIFLCANFIHARHISSTHLSGEVPIDCLNIRLTLIVLFRAAPLFSRLSNSISYRAVPLIPPDPLYIGMSERRVVQIPAGYEDEYHRLGADSDDDDDDVQRCRRLGNSMWQCHEMNEESVWFLKTTH